MKTAIGGDGKEKPEKRSYPALLAQSALHLMDLVEQGKVIKKTKRQTVTEITLSDGEKLWVTVTEPEQYVSSSALGIVGTSPSGT